VVEALVRRRRVVVVANAGALLVCAALLSAPSAGAATAVGRGFDPAAASTALARARMDAGTPSVLLQPKGGDDIIVPGAAAPAIDGDLLAYVDSKGIKIVDWRSGDPTPVARVDGLVSRPALDWPRLAFVRRGAEDDRLILANFRDRAAPTERRIASVPLRDDLGRPSLRDGRLAWHKVTRRESRVLVEKLSSGARRTIAFSERFVESNPALSSTRIVWVEQRPRSASLYVRLLGSGGKREIYRYRGRDRRLLTTSLTGQTAYVTRWAQATRDSTLVRVNF
jgi:hypothetical protein